MTVSFWINLLVCILALIPAAIDHGESYRELKASEGKARRWKLGKLILIWVLPIGALLAAGFSGREAVISERQAKESERRVALLDATNQLLRTSLEALRRYSHVATLNYKGTVADDTGDIKLSTPLSRLMEETMEHRDGKVFFHKTAENEARLRAIIEKFPDFPFAYMGMASCLGARSDANWIGYARRARDIFALTTSIPGHHPDHDSNLTRMNELLESADQGDGKNRQTRQVLRLDAMREGQ